MTAPDDGTVVTWQQVADTLPADVVAAIEAGPVGPIGRIAASWGGSRLLQRLNPWRDMSGEVLALIAARARPTSTADVLRQVAAESSGLIRTMQGG